MTATVTTEERKYEEVRKEIYNGLDNDKDRWMQQYILIIFDIIENKFRSCKAEHYNDMINAGIVGLLTARDKFDETRGTKFTTYAYISIHNAIVSYVRSINGARAGRNKWQRCYRKVKELAKQGIEYEDAWIKLRDSEKLDRWDFYVLWLQATGNDISYEVLVERNSSKEGTKESASDWFDIVDKDVNIENEVVSSDIVCQVYKYIDNCVTDWRKREICRRYIDSIINGDKWRGIEVAEKLGVSRQWVSQVVTALVEELKERIEK